MDVKGKAAIVTGGASGLGRATAEALVKAGAKVALLDRNEELTAETAAAIGALATPADVTDAASVTAALEKAKAAHGAARVCVNCAGIGGSVRIVDRKGAPMDLDHFRKIIEVNLIGTFRCIAKSAAGMLTLDPLEDGDRGAMVNTASVAAEDGQIGQAAYSASKGGVVGMTLPIARDLSREGIRVNTILPGIFDTPLLAGAPPQVRDALGAMVPHPPRLGVPDEYAKLALCMIETGYFNGEDVRLDGAIRMAPR